MSPLRDLPITFIGSFPDPVHSLDPVLPEIAFLGRSNVGKSSLLNALVGRDDLARVSSTPGKTTLLNVFRLPDFYLLDLPGYGYAKAAKTARTGFRTLLERCLTERPALRGVVWLLDIRHPPSAEDHRYRELLGKTGTPVLLTLTKADKLGVRAQRQQQREIALSLGFEDDQVQLTSSSTDLGIADLGAGILAAVHSEEDA